MHMTNTHNKCAVLGHTKNSCWSVSKFAVELCPSRRSHRGTCERNILKACVRRHSGHHSFRTKCWTQSSSTRSKSSEGSQCIQLHQGEDACGYRVGNYIPFQIHLEKLREGAHDQHSLKMWPTLIKVVWIWHMQRCQLRQGRNLRRDRAC